MDQLGSKMADDSRRDGLPPRPLHQRTWSGGVNLSGVKNMLTSFSPPIVTRKHTPDQDEKQEFHRQNQQFLQSVQRTPRGMSGKSASLRSMPIKETTSLEAIDDDWDEDHDSQSEDDDVPEAPDKIEFKGMHLLDEYELSQFSESSIDFIKDESAAYSCSESSFEISSPYQRWFQSKTDPKVGHEQEKILKERKKQLEERLSTVLDREVPQKPREKQAFVQAYMKELENEREALIKQWRAEFDAEEANLRCDQPFKSSPTESVFNKYIDRCRESVFNILATLEIFICNMPSTIAASALSWVTLGVVWFKFTAENLSLEGLCKPVHFHSTLNTYVHEFPGSFDCEDIPLYKAGLYFHFTCTIIAAVMACIFLAKVVLAWKVVSDDLSNPVTATPVGVMCITLEVIGAAAGKPGEVLVFMVAIFHGCFAVWYLYVAVVKFKLLPDPSWFPGTIGLAYAAVKTWLFSKVMGTFFLGLCVTFFVCIFFISFIRVALNKKIAAPVCFILLSAPSITLYAVTIMAQPTTEQEMAIQASPIAFHLYHEKMHDYYLPFQHTLFTLSLLAMVSVLNSIWARWDVLKHREFSPAHLAFCFPTLSHTNAIQAYRAAINSFSSIPKTSWFHKALYSYWVVCLLVGTVVNLIFTYKALVRLPKWTNINIAGETEPPEPSETIMSEMFHDTREVLDQSFVSPAVLQANETGTLIRVRRGTVDYSLHGPYVRTRHVTAYGFDPTLSDQELREERARLLDWVARNAPRTRNRTLSIPMMLKLKNDKGQGIYGTFDDQNPIGNAHRRSHTMGDIF